MLLEGLEVTAEVTGRLVQGGALGPRGGGGGGGEWREVSGGRGGQGNLHTGGWGTPFWRCWEQGGRHNQHLLLLSPRSWLAKSFLPPPPLQRGTPRGFTMKGGRVWAAAAGAASQDVAFPWHSPGYQL